MHGLKFDKTITLGDLCIALGLAFPLIVFVAKIDFRVSASETKISEIVQAQQAFQTSLEAEKDARVAYQADNDKQVTELQTVVSDRLGGRQ
ncbi:MAG TPA: hypothetical protein VH280_06915 [Verrucomicrobiae bacterium]|jgi:GTPase|nr:hypothetical protein [Verrucomicrobiae bacterium]